MEMEGIHGKTNINDDVQCHFLKLEGNLKFEDVVGPDSLDNVTRKEFLVRVKDVLGFPREADKMIKRIQKASGATIAIISSPEVEFHRQARMELWGTADQVEIAESTIVREITKLYYQRSFVPTILMQAPIYHNEVYVSVSQSVNLLGVTFENLVKMEAESGAWIVVDPLGISSPHIPMRRLNIFGNRDQVYRALMIVNKAILEPYKPEPSGTVQAANEHKNDSNVLGAETAAGHDFTLTEGGTSTMVNSSAAFESSLGQGTMVPATFPSVGSPKVSVDPITPVAPFVIQPPTPQVSTVPVVPKPSTSQVAVEPIKPAAEPLVLTPGWTDVVVEPLENARQRTKMRDDAHKEIHVA